MLIIETFFLINFNIFNMLLTVNTCKNVQVLQVTTRSHKQNKHDRLDSRNVKPLTCPQSPLSSIRVAFAVFLNFEF